MSVIAFPNIAPKGPGASIEWELRSNTARFPSPLTGYTRTLERYGSHWAAKLRYENLNTSEAARMRAFLSSCRGQAQRFYLRDFGYTQRGSFAATELLTNNTFANGTTGWSAQGSVLTESDGILRVTPTNAGSGSNPGVYQSATIAAYTPYALRSLILTPGFPYTAPSPQISDGVITGSSVGFGLRTTAIVTTAGGAINQFAGYISDSSGWTVKHYLEIAYASMGRCALVDNGPNATLYSDQIDNAAWTKSGATISANTWAAPDGTSTADGLTEDTSTGTHSAIQATSNLGAATDCVAYAMLRRTTPARDAIVFVGSTGSGNYAQATFDLAAGTVGTATAAGTAVNPRAFIVAMGDGWYACYVVARLPSGSPNGIQIRMVSGGSDSYTGTTGSIGVWRAGCAASSVPTRGMLTTTTADTDGTAQTGSALYLKGLPASTNGLLLIDDQAEIITPSGSQFVRARAALNSDAAGLGYFQFEPPLRESPADNAGVIIQTPLIRAMLDDRSVRWTQRHIGFTDLEFTAVEDITA